MRMKGIPAELTDWLAQKLHGRQTALLYDDYESQAFDVENGLDQGCPASIILYQLYNTPLLEKRISKTPCGLRATSTTLR